MAEHIFERLARERGITVRSIQTAGWSLLSGTGQKSQRRCKNMPGTRS